MNQTMWKIDPQQKKIREDLKRDVINEQRVAIALIND